MFVINRIIVALIFTCLLLGPAHAQTNSLWSTATIPANVNEPDTSSVELGVKFTSDVNGTVSAIRFYKGSQNTGTHAVSLWSSSGTKLATASSTNETASGWQTVTLSTPVSIIAGKTYVASYHTAGHYSDNLNYFTAAYSNGVLHAPVGAGVYKYGTTSAFPKTGGTTAIIGSISSSILRAAHLRPLRRSTAHAAPPMESRSAAHRPPIFAAPALLRE
jgi:Domain of unknown function (DUF4082)